MLIFELHSQLVKYWRRGRAADLTQDPKASVFDKLGAQSVRIWQVGNETQKSTYSQIGLLMKNDNLLQSQSTKSDVAGNTRGRKMQVFNNLWISFLARKQKRAVT